MTLTLKPIDEQVVVITGASSGIGLTTARMAAERGARVVLAARSADALQDAVAEIRAAGGQAEYVVADVTDRADVEAIAATAEDAYGGFDTWVNAAGVFIYGRLDETPTADMRKQFDVNVWGLLDGSLVAAEHLRNRGGAIINVGSIVSDRAFPLQGSYSASKHAVKGVTDTLRMELETEDAPISVTLVKPSAIATPYPKHAKNYMDDRATLPAPIYAPETVGRAIIHAAEHPEREVTVGGGGKVMTTLAQIAPGLTDAIMERFFFRLQRSDEPPLPMERNTLDEPTDEAIERGNTEARVRERSLYTTAQRRSLTAVLATGLAVAATAAWALGRRQSDSESMDREGRDEREWTRDGEASARARIAERLGR